MIIFNFNNWLYTNEVKLITLEKVKNFVMVKQKTATQRRKGVKKLNSKLGFVTSYVGDTLARHFSMMDYVSRHDSKRPQ